MMESNPHYKIVTHSHCNGNYRRTIRIPTGKNYFDTLSTTSSVGSALKLTRLRAEMIRSYLADSGIERKRIDIMPWAGKEMLIEETSADAVINDRIEIEVAEDK